jgi:sugar transferase (PEP-CTERM/EpsH1 system associated)
VRILYVTAGFPYPPRRGYLGIAYHQLRHLGERHEVHLASFVTGESDLTNLPAMRQWLSRVDLVPLPRWRSLLSLTASVGSQLPFQVAFHRSEEMAALVEQSLRHDTYDVALFQLTRMAQYRPAWYAGPTVLDMVDPLVLSYERSMPWRPPHLQVLLRQEVSRLREYEATHAPRFDRVLLIAEADIVDYERVLPHAHFAWVPYGVDVDSVPPPVLADRRPGMIVLSGNMFYGPNVQAVEYFCREILPLVRSRVPEATLWIVGARPASAVRRWATDPGIVVTGSVPDVRPYIREAMVCVCPVLLQVGTQTKVLEALASGTPVVTTAAGNNGVGGRSGEHLFVADAPTDFAARVAGLLRGERWSQLSENGRRLVSQRFTWERTTAQLEDVLCGVAGRAEAPA